MKTFFASALCFAAFLLGLTLGDNRQAAVRAGVAEYFLNSKTGEIEFRYKSEPDRQFSTPYQSKLEEWNP